MTNLHFAAVQAEDRRIYFGDRDREGYFHNCIVIIDFGTPGVSFLGIPKRTKPTVSNGLGTKELSFMIDSLPPESLISFQDALTSEIFDVIKYGEPGKSEFYKTVYGNGWLPISEANVETREVYA